MTNEIIEINQGKEVIYAFLSKMFLEIPSQSLFKMLQDITPMLVGFVENNEKVDNAVLSISNFISKRNSLKGKELEAFDNEALAKYTRLFCLGKGVVTSESYYTSQDKLVLQESRDEVLSIYRQCKFSTDFDDSNEPEDHISYELMFMSYLSKLAGNSLSQGNMERYENIVSIQKDFLENNLLKWIDEFTNSLSKYPESNDLYIHLAIFLKEYLEADFKYLSTLNNTN